MADKAIGDLTAATQIDDDSLLVVEQQGTAMKMTGKQFADFAREAAAADVQRAVDAADAAEKSDKSASTSAYHAQESADAAEESRQAIENMSVSATTLAPGSEATVTKNVVDGVVKLTYGIPQGKQGETGPQGKQGVQGIQGERGISGVAVAADGVYAFNVNEEGHLILSYTGDEAPDFRINDSGHLILTL